MNKDLLTKAVFNDTAALSTLRRTLPPGLTVFVAPGGKLHINATLAAWEYFKLHQVEPDEWGDESTLTFAQAFPAKVKRDPLKLKPVTPGLWTDLWEQEPEMVAAIYWGRTTGNIRDGDLELKGRVRRHLKAPDSFLQDVLRTMKRDERKAQDAMDAVSAPVEQAAIQPTVTLTLEVAPGVEKRAGLQAALADLEREYGKGMLDIGRYMRLKESLTAELRACFGSKWQHQRYVALRDFIVAAYNLDELKTVCFRVGVSFDDLGGGGKSAKVLRFIDNRQRRGLLDEVAQICRQERPAMWAKMMG